MQSFTKFDEKIRLAVSQEANKVNANEGLLKKINGEIELKEKGNRYMNNRKRTRGLLVACALLVLTTITCFAATRIVNYSGHLEDRFEEYPSERQMERVAGFLPKYVESFKNGYKFEIVFVGEYDGESKEGDKNTKLKSAEFTYVKDKDSVYLYTMQMPEGTAFEGQLKGEQIFVNKDLSIIYYDYYNKMKPADYEMTHQDKEDEASGKYVFSFGEDYDTVKHIQTLGWEQEGITYSLECYDEKLTKDELVEMAKQIINK
ncbi:MAG: hypothetical protein ACK5MV_01710 [Aminipila sp.]